MSRLCLRIRVGGLPGHADRAHDFLRPMVRGDGLLPPWTEWWGNADVAEAEEAARRGWAVKHLPGLQLHQLVDPDAVAERIVTITRSWANRI